MAFDAVEATDVVKLWGSTRALAGVSARFTAGEVTVVEGPNGAGKSTLLALLAQLGRPTAGRIRYGAVPTRHARRHIGVLTHASMLYPDLTGREDLTLFAALYGVAVGPGALGPLVARFELAGFLDRAARTYSRGQLQRVAIARALIHAPALLLLDEPSTGLDVEATKRLVETVAAERARGAIVVVVTHDADLAERVSTRRLRLERGRVAG